MQGAGAASSQPDSGSGPHLTVKVMLDPALIAKVAPGDTVFVYAKAANGPPMPLAIQRLRADQLPATVVLTDGMGMMPSMRLSQFPQVIIGARVSKSGNAIAQSGDLQTLSKPLNVASTAPINLTIDTAVP
jgi:cytochrome c-type biogenesis protein CcmH